MSDKCWLPFILLVILASIFTMTEAKSQTIELTNFQERWAILVGVGAYPEGSGIPTLEYPKDDVQKLQSMLVTRGAFEPSNIETLIDDQATKGRLEDTFKKLRSSIKENDLLLFYFSGRGARVKSGLYADEEQDELNECLLLYDSTRKSEEKFFRDAELGQLLFPLKAKRIVIIIDACYSPSGNRAKSITTAADAAAVAGRRDGIKNDYIPRGKTIILEACAPDSETHDGVFTQRFVETLQDDTTHGKDGIITLQETWEYLKTDLSNQEPQMSKIGVRDSISLIQPLITIASQPGSAEVFVDNTQLFDESRHPVTTPTSIVLPIGNHQITLRKWGYRISDQLSRKVEKPGKQELVNLKLEPASIKGKLIYENSGKPVVGANVKLDLLRYETKTNNQGEFVFNNWERYKILPGVKYQIQISDEKDRVPEDNKSFELGKEFYEDKTIYTISLRNLAHERRMKSWRNIGIGMAILISLSATIAYLWKIRPARIKAYQEQNYPIWENEISTRLRTLGKADLDWIQQKHWLYVQNLYIQEHSDTRLVPGEGYISYPVQIAERVADFHDAWNDTKKNLSRDTSEQINTFRKSTRRVTDVLCRALGFSRVDAEEEFDGLYGHLVNAPTLRLKIPIVLPFIYIQQTTPTDDDLESLIDLMRKLDVIQRFAFVMVFSDSQSVQKKLVDKGLRRSYDFIVLDEDNLRDILIAEDTRELATKIILSQVELTKFAPYVTSGPTPPNIFFGREWEINTILHTLRQNNIALLGGRRVGKTSLLHRIRYILVKKERAIEYNIPEENLQFSHLYLNCQGAIDYEGFLLYAAHQWHVDVPLDSLKDFYDFVSRKRKVDKNLIVILIDEADGIVKYDPEHENQLFGMFRTLSTTDVCRFVFTGERTIHRDMLNPDSPLFNLCQLFSIGYLNEKSARLLVSEPMKLIGVQFEDEGIIDQIVKLTSCHPRMVQWVCFELLKKINKEGTRNITLTHLKELENSMDFQNEFISTIRGQRTAPLEQLISLFIIEKDAPMSVAEIEDKLEEMKLNVSDSELNETLRILQLTSVLTEENGNYQFLAKSFSRIFRKNKDTKNDIEKLKEEIRNERN